MSFFHALNDHPKITAWLGTLSGWAAVDWLRSSQIVAAVLAALVSLCALILTLPKVVAEIKSWF